MSVNRKSWFRLRLRTILLLLVGVLVAWSGYSYWSDYQTHAARKAREMLAPSVGAVCTVTLDGDKRVSGKFVELNDDWIVLKFAEGKEQLWIPRDRILLMRESE
jgi:predicted negative regulator of RcsB-dependent stress response